MANSAISALESSLASMGYKFLIGLRFCPTDIEVVNHFLKSKVLGLPFCSDFMVDIDDLPWIDPSTLPGEGDRRYFFSKKLRNAVTMSRFWTPMGQEKEILDPVSKEVVGIRQALVLVHTDGKMPSPLNQRKSLWFMYEYRLAEMHGTGQEEWAAYQVFLKEIKTYDDIYYRLLSETDESEESDDGERDEEENDVDMPDCIDHVEEAEDSSRFGPPPPDSPSIEA